MGEIHPEHNKSLKFAKLLDSWFSIPGTNIKVGLDSILGFVTGVGDLVGASLSTYFMFYAIKLGATTSVILRMFMNIMTDLVIGFIPILGDLFDVGWKANLRNAKLLEKLEEDPEKFQKQSTMFMWMLFGILVLILLAIITAIGWAVAEIWNILY